MKVRRRRQVEEVEKVRSGGSNRFGVMKWRTKLVALLLHLIHEKLRS